MSYNPDDALYLKFSADLNELCVRVESYLSSRSMFKTGGQLFALNVDNEKIERLRTHEEQKVRTEMLRLGIDDWHTRKIPLVERKRTVHLMTDPSQIARERMRLAQERQAREEAAAKLEKAAEEQKRQPEQRKSPAPKPPSMRPPAARKVA